MILVNLTHWELLKSFHEFDAEGFYIDLHNEFSCEIIDFDKQKSELLLSFNPINNNQKAKKVDIIFKQISLEHFSLRNDESDKGFYTIDNIYRGLFENGTSNIQEKSDNDQYYFYIDFYQDCSFELFAKNVEANIYLKE
jgi:hypothetical protein